LLIAAIFYFTHSNIPLFINIVKGIDGDAARAIQGCLFN